MGHRGRLLIVGLFVVFLGLVAMNIRVGAPALAQR
jgi:hypothetical protein